MPRGDDGESGARRRRWALLRARILGAAMGVVLWLWRRTVRLEVRGLERLEEVGIAPLAVWHGRVHGSLYAMKGRPAGAMFSASPDGEMAARALAVFGVDSVRGSTGKGGGQALAELIRKVEERHLRFPALTVDGPRGPCRRAKPGIVHLATALSAPVYPISFSATRVWMLRSWDRAVLARPFSRVVAEIGEPVHLEPGEPVERSLERIDRALDALTERLDLEVHGSLLWEDCPGRRGADPPAAERLRP